VVFIHNTSLAADSCHFSSALPPLSVVGHWTKQEQKTLICNNVDTIIVKSSGFIPDVCHVLLGCCSKVVLGVLRFRLRHDYHTAVGVD